MEITTNSVLVYFNLRGAILVTIYDCNVYKNTIKSRLLLLAPFLARYRSLSLTGLDYQPLIKSGNRQSVFCL